MQVEQRKEVEVNNDLMVIIITDNNRYDVFFVRFLERIKFVVKKIVLSMTGGPYVRNWVVFVYMVSTQHYPRMANNQRGKEINTQHKNKISKSGKTAWKNINPKM